MKKLVNKRKFSVKNSVWDGNTFVETITEYDIGSEFWGYSEYYFVVGFEGNKPIKELSNFVLIGVKGHGNLICIDKNIFE